MSDFTPNRAYREGFRWAAPVTVLGILAVVVVAAIVFVGWQVGWWFSNQNVNRQAHQIQNGYSNQTTLHQQVTSNIATVTSLTTQIDGAANSQQAADLKAQRAAVAATACLDASEVSSADPLPAGQQQWVSTNCSDGVVSPNSSLYTGGN